MVKLSCDNSNCRKKFDSLIALNKHIARTNHGSKVAKKDIFKMLGKMKITLSA